MTESKSSGESNAWLESADGELMELAPSFKIGRSEECDIRVEGAKASREHALLNFDLTKRHWWLTDLASTNGTYLNGRRIINATLLRSGDRLRIGPITWFFRQEDTSRDDDETVVETDPTAPDVSNVVCWLLIGDVIESTRLSLEMGADELNSKMNDWAKACQTIVERHGGFINEFMGDGFLALWSEPAIDPEMLLNALEELHGLEKESPLPFRLVVHRGAVLFGGGAPSSGVEAITGTDVNFIFKAEKIVGAVAEHRTFISETAAGKLNLLADLERIGEFIVPAFPDPVAFYTLRDSG